jgi:hypothetical protein
MAADTSKNAKKIHALVLRALKATVEGVILYAVYFFLSQFLTPLSEFVPGFQQMVETFVMVYIVLIMIAELTAGSIFHHFFDAAKSLFIIAYLAVALGTGMFTLTVQGMNFVVDIHLFVLLAMLLALLGLAKSVIETIDYVNQKAELVLF